MRWIVVVAALALLGACENRAVKSDANSISIEGGDLARENEMMAEAHCAQYGKTPRLRAVEPMTFVTWIHHYDCI